MFRLRQQFEGPTIADVALTVRTQLAGLPLTARIRAGQRVAVTAGSRGIANIKTIVTAIVDYLKEIGAQPFIVQIGRAHV